MPRKKTPSNSEIDLFALKSLVAAALTEAGTDKIFVESIFAAAGNIMRTFGYTEKQVMEALQKYLAPSSAVLRAEAAPAEGA